MRFKVYYAGWEYWEGDDEAEAYRVYRSCGPYGTIEEVA